MSVRHGRIAQLVEHLPYKQAVIGSSPIAPTINIFGPVAQLVRALACHARGRGFEPHPGRQKIVNPLELTILLSALVAQSVEQGTENPRVRGSIPPQGTKYLRGSGSVVEHCLAKAAVAGSSPVFRSR